MAKLTHESLRRDGANELARKVADIPQAGRRWLQLDMLRPVPLRSGDRQRHDDRWVGVQPSLSADHGDRPAEGLPVADRVPEIGQEYDSANHHASFRLISMSPSSSN